MAAAVLTDIMAAAARTALKELTALGSGGGGEAATAMEEGALSRKADVQLPMHSSAIRAATYSPDEEKLTVTFHNGQTYIHESVPPQTALALATAPSQGAYYDNNLRQQPNTAGAVSHAVLTATIPLRGVPRPTGKG